MVNFGMPNFLQESDPSTDPNSDSPLKKLLYGAVAGGPMGLPGGGLGALAQLLMPKSQPSISGMPDPSKLGGAAGSMGGNPLGNIGAAGQAGLGAIPGLLAASGGPKALLGRAGGGALTGGASGALQGALLGGGAPGAAIGGAAGLLTGLMSGKQGQKQQMPINSLPNKDPFTGQG